MRDTRRELAKGSQLLGLHETVLRGTQIIEGLREFPGARLYGIEQLDIADRDRCLVGERCRQFDLLLRERTRFLPRHDDYADGGTLAQHWDREHGAKLGKPTRLGEAVLRIGQHIGDMNGCPFKQSAPDRRAPVRRDGNGTGVFDKPVGKPIGFRPKEHAISLARDLRHVGIAKPGNRLDKSLQHSLQVERRPADDFQDIGGGGLLLQ